MRRVVKIQFIIFIIVLFFASYYVLLTYFMVPIIGMDRLNTVPVIQKFFDDHPDATFEQDYINESSSAQAVLDMLQGCGIDVDEKPYILVTIRSGDDLLKAYFDPVTQDIICVYNPNESGPGSGEKEDGGGSGGGGEQIIASCSSDVDCNDNDPATMDSCVDGACVHTPIGGCIGDSCGGEYVSGSGCVLDSDCTSNSPIFTGSCENGYCRYTVSGCGVGDDDCPEGCTADNDPDCT